MSKKIIKYLIWIILIIAILILMPITETRAADITVEYDDFKKDEGMFCLNKGWQFSWEEKFTKSSKITGTTFSFPNGTTVDMDIIEYIISEATSGKYDGRNSVADFVPQVAIWKLAGSNVSGDRLYAKANKLVNTAKAYNSFLDNGCFKEPVIEKINSNQFAVYYNKTNYGNGSYTNLMKVSIRGGEATLVNEGVTSNKEGFTHMDIYEKKGDSTTLDITVKYETGRNATLYLYSAKENQTEYREMVANHNNESTKISVYGSGRFCCYNCGAQDSMVSEDVIASGSNINRTVQIRRI